MSTHNQPSSSSAQEQTYSILPHPAKTNDPADLAPVDPQSGRGLDSKAGVFNARGPYIPSNDILNRVEQPKTREELRALSAQLNSGNEK